MVKITKLKGKITKNSGTNDRKGVTEYQTNDENYSRKQ